MDLEQLKNTSEKVVIPRSVNKLRYFRGVVLKEITDAINSYQGDVVYTPDEILEEVIKPHFYFEWEYNSESDDYKKVNLSLRDISDGRMYQLISDCITWAEMMLNIEISQP